MLDAGCVDTVELAVIPILLGGGIPMLPSPARRRPLKLTSYRAFRSDIVLLEYAVLQATSEHDGEASAVPAQ
jgi:hypothetical protein